MLPEYQGLINQGQALSVALNVLVVGGSGEISNACAAEALRCGHTVTVFNRGTRDQPPGVRHLRGSIQGEDAQQLRHLKFDVVCQFLAFNDADIVV